MVARLLNSWGLYLGPQDRLLDRYPSNPEGHFEHLGVLKVNDALLRKFGGSWDHLPRLKMGWQDSESLKGARAQAISLVESFLGTGRWGWKDPRTTVLLLFGKSVVENLRFVVCLRSPLDAAS